MPNDRPAIWLAAGLRTPFVAVDGPFANRDSLALSVPVVLAMAPQVTGPIDFAVTFHLYEFRTMRSASLPQARLGADVISWPLSKIRVLD